MELNTATLNDFVKLAEVIWLKQSMSLPMQARQSGIFKEVPVPLHTGNTREFSEIDLQEYASRKDEGDQSSRAQVQQGYTKIMTKYRVSEDIGITYEMRTENKYEQVISRLTNLSRLVFNRMELDLQHRITFGTATSYTDRDGETVDVSTGDTLSLFNTAHTLRGSATTYRNRLAGNARLSKGSLVGMERNAVEQTYNQLGEKKVINYDILFTTDDPEDINTARELLLSTADPSQDNPGVYNNYSSKYRHVVLSRVATDANGNTDTTKRHYFGIVSSEYFSAYLGIWEEPHLKLPSNLNAGEDFSTDDWNFGARGGYGITIVSGCGIQFSSGDGVA